MIAPVEEVVLKIPKAQANELNNKMESETRTREGQATEIKYHKGRKVGKQKPFSVTLVDHSSQSQQGFVLKVLSFHKNFHHLLTFITGVDPENFSMFQTDFMPLKILKILKILKTLNFLCF